jgi:hypothetical protein
MVIMLFMALCPTLWLVLLLRSTHQIPVPRRRRRDARWFFGSATYWMLSKALPCSSCHQEVDVERD